VLRTFVVDGVRVRQTESRKLGSWKACVEAALGQLGVFFVGKRSRHFNDASDEASAAGEVQRSVAVTVSYVRRRATVDQQSHDGRLVGDDSEVESGLAELEVLKIEKCGLAVADRSKNKIHDRIRVLTNDCQMQFPVQALP